MSKTSFTGFFDMRRENARFENNLFTELGSLYYHPSSGFNYDQIANQNVNISPNTMNTWIIQQASSHSIIVLSSSVRVEDYSLKLNYQIAGENEQTSDTGGFFNVLG